MLYCGSSVGAVFLCTHLSSTFRWLNTFCSVWLTQARDNSTVRAPNVGNSLKFYSLVIIYDYTRIFAVFQIIIYMLRGEREQVWHLITANRYLGFIVFDVDIFPYCVYILMQQYCQRLQY